VSVDVGTVGVWLLIASAVAIVIESALAMVWSLRIASRSAAMQKRIQAEQAQIRADVERLRSALAQTQVLWEPYARLLRWFRHPLTIAVLQSYARRRRRTVP